MAERLPTYLRTYRKRSGLTQDEFSRLLGCESGVSVCEYERLRKVPTLEKAIACEVVTGVSVEELFPGIYKKALENVVLRARTMSRELPEDDMTPKVKLKRGRLEAILARFKEEHKNNVWKTEVANSPAS